MHIRKAVRVCSPADGEGSSRSRHLRRTILLSLAILLLPLAIMCTAKAQETIYGTWVNIGTTGDYKFVFSPDGTSTYVNRSGTIRDEGRFMIERKWFDSAGNTWYTMKTRWHTGAFREEGAVIWYSSHKIDLAGKTREADASMQDYPKDFYGPVGMGGHQIHQSQ